MFRESAQRFDSSFSDEVRNGGLSGFDRYRAESRPAERPLSSSERQFIVEEAILGLEKGLQREPDLLGGDLPLRRDVAATLRVLAVSEYPEAAIRLLRHALQREPDLLGGDLPLRGDITFALQLLKLLTSRS